MLNKDVIRDDITLDWINVSQMVVDPKYQRSTQVTRINKMAASWDTQAAGAVVLAQKSKEYALLDGMHRWEAAKKAGIAQLASVVYHNLTVARQAQLFVIFNRDRSNTVPVDVFRARLAQGDEDARTIDRIVRASGQQIGVGRTYFQAITSAELIYERFGGETLAAIVNVMARAWANDPISRGNAVTMRAIAMMYSHYSASSIDWDVLEQTLRRTPCPELIRAAGMRRISGAGRLPQLAAQVLSELYNENFGNKRTGKLVYPSSVGAFGQAIRSYTHDDIDNTAGLRVVRVDQPFTHTTG